MSALRRFGNVALSFLAKAATDTALLRSHHVFVAIRAAALGDALYRIDPRYFFEISMLSNLYLLGAVVKEEHSRHYADEPSSLRSLEFSSASRPPLSR